MLGKTAWIWFRIARVLNRVSDTCIEVGQEVVVNKEKQCFGRGQELTDPFGAAASQRNGVKAAPFSNTSTLNIYLAVKTEGSSHEILQRVITLRSFIITYTSDYTRSTIFSRNIHRLF